MTRIRRFPLIRDASVALTIAVVLVGVAVGLRWNGARTGSDAWVPLRPLIATEAAALLRYTDRDGDGRASVVALDDQTAVVASSVFLLPARPSAAEVVGTLGAGGMPHTLHAVSWAGFHSRYRLPRPALEAALGRPLGPADVNTDGYPAAKIAFDPARVPWYAFAETLLLVILLLVLLTIWRWTRLGSAVLAAASVMPILLIFFVMVYSPAFGDADWFHHRILVEDLALRGMIISPALGGLALLVLAIEVYRAHGRRQSTAGIPTA